MKNHSYLLNMTTGPLFILLSYLLLQDGLGLKVSIAIGTLFWMGLWWITRPVHIAVTALIPIAVNSIFNLVPMKDIIAPYFSEIIILLFAGDLICMSWTNTGLDKRLSLKALCLIGPSMKQQIAVWLTAPTLLSIFLPNAVVCTILMPVAVSMLKFVGEDNIKTSKVAAVILLAIAWGAGIGGFGSPLGGAANLVAISYIEEFTGKEFMYLSWVIRFLPILAIILVLNLAFLYSMPLGIKTLNGTGDYFKKLYTDLGKMTKYEYISLFLFLLPMILSFFRPAFAKYLPAMKPAYIFLLFGLSSFLIKKGDSTPLITWQEVEKHMMWGMLYLFGGGLALGKLITGSGAASKIADLIATMRLTGGIETFFAFVLFCVVLSEISSNTAAAAISVPVVITISTALGISVIAPLYASIVAFNCAYVLPVSIRAIPVGFGLDSQVLIKNGLKLTTLSIITITIVTYLFSLYYPPFTTL